MYIEIVAIARSAVTNDEPFYIKFVNKLHTIRVCNGLGEVVCMVVSNDYMLNVYTHDGHVILADDNITQGNIYRTYAHMSKIYYKLICKGYMLRCGRRRVLFLEFHFLRVLDSNVYSFVKRI